MSYQMIKPGGTETVHINEYGTRVKPNEGDGFEGYCPRCDSVLNLPEDSIRIFLKNEAENISGRKQKTRCDTCSAEVSIETRDTGRRNGIRHTDNYTSCRRLAFGRWEILFTKKKVPIGIIGLKGAPIH